MHLLSYDEEAEFSTEANIVHKDFYVDHLMTGSFDIDAPMDIQLRLTNLDIYNSPEVVQELDQTTTSEITLGQHEEKSRYLEYFGTHHRITFVSNIYVNPPITSKHTKRTIANNNSKKTGWQEFHGMTNYPSPSWTKCYDNTLQTNIHSAIRTFCNCFTVKANQQNSTLSHTVAQSTKFTLIYRSRNSRAHWPSGS